jgi:hypothetical protein
MWQVTWRILMPSEAGANGAFCKAGELTRTALEHAVVNYVNREINPSCLQVPELTFLTAGKADCNQKPAAWEPSCLRSDGSRMG